MVITSHNNDVKFEVQNVDGHFVLDGMLCYLTHQ